MDIESHFAVRRSILTFEPFFLPVVDISAGRDLAILVLACIQNQNVMKNKINVEPKHIAQSSDWDEFVTELKKSISNSTEIALDLEAMDEVDLAQFNSLVMLYTALRRKNKKLVFLNCQNMALQNLIDKTNFNHVFSN